MYPDLITLPKNRAYPLQNQPCLLGQKLHFSIRGNELAVRDGLADIVASMRIFNLADEECGTIELVLAEVMNNIVEHAYADTPDGLIKVVIQPKEHGLFCTFNDDGLPMPEGTAPLGNLSALDSDIDDLPEGGFGWFLIRDLARDLDYSRKSGKNILTFRIAISMSQLLVS